MVQQLNAQYTSQTITVFAETGTLVSEIPTQPIIIQPEHGSPSPTHQWYGILGERLITIESEATGAPHNSVVIHTIFLKNQDMFGDWIVLRELQELPKAIYIKRPLFIESRVLRPKCAVYRPDPQGWKTAIYAAASQMDAEELLKFIKQDTWNETCFVGEPASPGKWVIVQGQSVILGTGSGLNEALKFACEWSLRYAPEKIIVKDISGTTKDVYVVFQGKSERQVTEKKGGRV